MTEIPHDASAELHGTGVESVLRELLARAMASVAADSGALAVFTSTGAVEDFVALGVGALEVERPLGRGGPPSRTRAVRWNGVEWRSSDCVLPIPASARAFLGVPLALEEEDGGLLFFYLARSAGDGAFTESDEEQVAGLQALAALAVAHARLLELEQVRAQAISIFIHELRSPLAVIAGIADLLQRPAREITDDLRAELTEILDRESSRLLRLVSNVLDVESVNHSQGSMEIERCDLVELAAEAALDAGGKERIAVVAPGAPLSAPVDRDRIKQVLVNLVSNALKFSPEAAPITLSVQDKEGWVEVTVEDYGAGIAANDLPKLFNMFSRVGDQDKPGSGLGLYASKAIVEQHGGSMWVESEPGRGSCFGFRLPGPG